VLTNFRSYLSRCLAKAYQNFPEIQKDKRVAVLIDQLPKQNLGRDYVISQNKDRIQIDQLDGLSKQSYPLCMEHIHDTLRKKKHHLKHFGRLQYNLFLKGIGVTLEDVLEFWRDELEKKRRKKF